MYVGYEISRVTARGKEEREKRGFTTFSFLFV